METEPNLKLWRTPRDVRHVPNCSRRTSRLLTTQPATSPSEQTLRGMAHRAMMSCRSSLSLGAGGSSSEGDSQEKQDRISFLIYTTKGLSLRCSLPSLLLCSLHRTMG